MYWRRYGNIISCRKFKSIIRQVVFNENIQLFKRDIFIPFLYLLLWQHIIAFFISIIIYVFEQVLILNLLINRLIKIIIPPYPTAGYKYFTIFENPN